MLKTQLAFILFAGAAGAYLAYQPLDSVPAAPTKRTQPRPESTPQEIEQPQNKTIVVAPAPDGSLERRWNRATPEKR